MIDDFNRLKLRDGEEVAARHVNALAATVGATQYSGGRNVRISQAPWGIMVSHDSRGGGGYESPYFAPVAQVVDGGAVRVQFGKGLFAGLEPTIDGVAISGANPETGQAPALIIPPEKFNAIGEARVFFRLEITRVWELSRITPVAAPDYLADEAWVTHKLAAVVYSDGSVWRQLFANQNWLAVNRRSTGRALHLFWPRL